MFRNRFRPRLECCGGCCGKFRLPPNDVERVKFRLRVIATNVVDAGTLFPYGALNGTHELRFNTPGGGGDTAYHVWSKIVQGQPGVVPFLGFSVFIYDTPIPPEHSFFAIGVSQWPLGGFSSRPDSEVVARVLLQHNPAVGSPGVVVTIEYYVSARCTRYYRGEISNATPLRPAYRLAPPAIAVSRVVVRRPIAP